MMKKLSNSTSLARDNIDSLSIKIVAPILYKPLNYLINLSIESCVFSNHWKLAKVVSLHKGKGKYRYNPESYRHISLLPVCSKIVELTIQKQIVSYMTTTNQWSPSNHAYKSHHRTTTAMLSLTDRIFEACDKKKISTAIATDQTAAFDCVPHDLLLKKL